MSNVLVVFHSRSGHCRTVAESLREARGWALGVVVYLAGSRSHGQCARDALLRREPQIRYQGPSPSVFDAVVLVSPIGVWQLCRAMRRFRSGRLPRETTACTARGRFAWRAASSRAFSRRPVRRSACRGRLVGRAV